MMGNKVCLDGSYFTDVTTYFDALTDKLEQVPILITQYTGALWQLGFWWGFWWTWR